MAKREHKLHILRKNAIYCYSKPQTLCGRPGWVISWYYGGQKVQNPQDGTICGACFHRRLRAE